MSEKETFFEALNRYVKFFELNSSTHEVYLVDGDPRPWNISTVRNELGIVFAQLPEHFASACLTLVELCTFEELMDGAIFIPQLDSNGELLCHTMDLEYVSLLGRARSEFNNSSSVLSPVQPSQGGLTISAGGIYKIRVDYESTLRGIIEKCPECQDLVPYLDCVKGDVYPDSYVPGPYMLGPWKRVENKTAGRARANPNKISIVLAVLSKVNIKLQSMNSNVFFSLRASAFSKELKNVSFGVCNSFTPIYALSEQTPLIIDPQEVAFLNEQQRTLEYGDFRITELTGRIFKGEKVVPNLLSGIRVKPEYLNHQAVHHPEYSDLAKALAKAIAGVREGKVVPIALNCGWIGIPDVTTSSVKWNYIPKEIVSAASEEEVVALSAPVVLEEYITTESGSRAVVRRESIPKGWHPWLVKGKLGWGERPFDVGGIEMPYSVAKLFTQGGYTDMVRDPKLPATWIDAVTEAVARHKTAELEGKIDRLEKKEVGEHAAKSASLQVQKSRMEKSLLEKKQEMENHSASGSSSNSSTGELFRQYRNPMSSSPPDGPSSSSFI